jgi:hypothetical protein
MSNAAQSLEEKNKREMFLIADKMLEKILHTEGMEYNKKCRKCVKGRIGYVKRGRTYVASICGCVLPKRREP